MDSEIPLIGVSKRTMISSLFIMSGYLYKKHFESREHQSTCGALIMIVLCFLFVLMVSIFIPSSLNKFDGKSVIPLYLWGCIGTYGILLLFRDIIKGDSTVLSYIGNNTLNILTWHFLSFKIVSLIIICLNGLDILNLSEFPVIGNFASSGWWCAYFIIGVALPCSCLYVQEEVIKCVIKRK